MMKMSKKGYKKNSPDRKNPFNIIPSGKISMKNVPHPIMGIDNTGVMQMMIPGGEYKFPGSHVVEFPMRSGGNYPSKQQGGSIFPPYNDQSSMATVEKSEIPSFKKGGNWDRTKFTNMFKGMSKNAFGSSNVPQGMDTDSVIAKNKNTFTGYVSGNMLERLAEQEADELGVMMERGGNFGYNPNMYNQQMYGAGSVNTLPQEWGNFMNLSRQGFTNPYYQMNVAKGGGSRKGYMQTGGGVDNPQANMEYLKNKYYSEEGITDEFGNVYTSADLYNQDNPQANNNPNKKMYPMGNYTPPVRSSQDETLQPGYTSKLSYIPKQQTSRGYGMFPMNFSQRGTGMNFTGIPNVDFDPSQVYLKDYQYKSRLFGQGPRKVSMTFSPLTGKPVTGVTGGSDSGITPIQEKESFIERHIDPTLYSKMVEGDASDDEISKFNEQYQKYSRQYEDRQTQVKPPTGEPVRKSLGTRIQNFLQEQQVERERKRRMRNPEFKTAVHPSLRKQDGGDITKLPMTPVTKIPQNMEMPAIPNTGGFQGDVTLEWKRKMGINPQEVVSWGLAGMNALSAFGESMDAKKNQEIMQQRMNADALFQPITAGAASRGTYDPNTGAFRPNQMTPVQFSGMNFGQVGSPANFKQGGEYNLSEEEIQQILAMGGTIEYIE